MDDSVPAEPKRRIRISITDPNDDSNTLDGNNVEAKISTSGIGWTNENVKEVDSFDGIRVAEEASDRIEEDDEMVIGTIIFLAEKDMADISSSEEKVIESSLKN